VKGVCLLVVVNSRFSTTVHDTIASVIFLSLKTARFVILLYQKEEKANTGSYRAQMQ
jgi:hypothetical protein